MAPSMQRFFALLCLTALPGLAVGWGIPAVAQTDTFEGYEDVVEVRVPVNVVAKDGTPLRGLTAEDFEVFDRGDLQEITDFEVVDFEVLQPAAGEVVGASDYDGSEIAPAARRHFLLFFDLSFSTPASVIKARLAARDFVLNNLHPADLAAVATFSLDTGPRLIVTFTPDRAQLARAIDTLGAPRLLANRAKVDPLRFIIEDPLDATTSASSLQDEGTPDNPRLLSQQNALQAHLSVISKQISRVEKSFERGKIGAWAGALRDVARILGSVSGRKHIVYFSEGFDGRLLLGRGSDPSDPVSANEQIYLQQGVYWMVDTDDIYGNSSLQSDIDLMLEEFRRADCVIQAVDISGLTAEGGDQARAKRFGQDALFYIANETGGELFEDANDLGRQLERVLTRTEVTYVLTFQPKDIERDGSYHRLEIKADVPRSAHVAHRTGYYAPRPFKDLHPLEKSLLASDAIAVASPRDEIGLHVLAAPFRANETRSYVPIIIEVPGQDLLSGHEGNQLSTEFYTYVSNSKGEMQDFFSQIVSFEIGGGRELLEKTGLKYYGHLSVGPGDYLVRVLVRNADTGRTGVKSLSLSVPEYAQAEPVLLPPFFYDPPEQQWVMVREKRDDAYQRTVIYPFTVNGEPFVPAARASLSQGEPAEICLVAYNLSDGELILDGRVLNDEGREVGAGSLALIERTITGIRGLDKLRATFQPGGLERGNYTLQVAVTHPETGAKQVNSVPFSVVN